MPNEPKTDEQKLLFRIIEGLQEYSDEDKLRLLRTVSTYFSLDDSTINVDSTSVSRQQASHFPPSGPQLTHTLSFSDHPSISLKEFLHEKNPRTDIERVACLAYYLAHYRDTPHFKTIDISKLNTEAAQLKFSNAAYAVNNTTKRGLLASAGKGNKQISTYGEQFVSALPDRDAAKAVLENSRKRRTRRNMSGNKKKKIS